MSRRSLERRWISAEDRYRVMDQRDFNRQMKDAYFGNREDFDEHPPSEISPQQLQLILLGQLTQDAAPAQTQSHENHSQPRQLVSRRQRGQAHQSSESTPKKGNGKGKRSRRRI